MTGTQDDTGPDAPVRAEAAALAAAATARCLLLVEGVSDRIALETLAARQGRDLAAERIVVAPIGGAHATARYVTRFGLRDAGTLAGGLVAGGLVAGGLVDAGEEHAVRQGLTMAGVTVPPGRDGLERLGFFVCVADLEDELVRAAGQHLVEEVLAEAGDLASFRTLQQQPAWRGHAFEEQMHRFLAAGSRRKLRYARLLVQALDPQRLPRPLTELLQRA